MDYAYYSISLILAFAFARYVTENTSIHLKFNFFNAPDNLKWPNLRPVDTSLDSCYSCNDSFVVTRDFRAICLGSINRRGVRRFAEEKLVD